MRLLSAAVLASLLASTCLTGCAAPLVAGAAGAATAANSEGGISQTVDDHAISLELHDALFRYNPAVMNKVNQEVNQGRVMLTGIVQNPQHRVDVVRIAWQIKGVKQVINEIKVQQSEGVSGYSRDAWIGTQLRSKMLFDTEIASRNYNTDVVGGVIYIMGIAQNQTELNKVMAYARSIKYVRDVVSYVHTRDQLSSGFGGEIGSGAGRTTTTSTSNSYNANNGSATVNNTSTYSAPATTSGGGYDYQPETRRGGVAPVESNDLGPVR